MRTICLPDGSTRVVVVAAMLFVYTRHHQSPAYVPWFLSLIWLEMRLLCWERVMCERKVKKDVPAWSLLVNLLSTIFLFCFEASTQLARRVAETHTGVCSNKMF